jgi:hypothetical protein
VAPPRLAVAKSLAPRLPRRLLPYFPIRSRVGGVGVVGTAFRRKAAARFSAELAAPLSLLADKDHRYFEAFRAPWETSPAPHPACLIIFLRGFTLSSTRPWLRSPD